MLVGGRDPSTLEVTNQLLTFTNGRDLEISLPPMPTSRHRTTAVSGRSPEILVVAGGRDSDFNKVDIVEVLQGDQWTTATPLPTHCSDMRSTFYESDFYFSGGNYQQKLIHTCSYDTLVASGHERTVAQSVLRKIFSQQVWRKMTARYDTRAITFCSSRLILTNTEFFCGYSNISQKWLKTTDVGSVPEYDSYFISLAVLCVIVSVLTSNHSRLTARVKLRQRYYEWGAKIPLPDPKTDPVQSVEKVIIQWSLEYSDILPTWAHLLEVLRISD